MAFFDTEKPAVGIEYSFVTVFRKQKARLIAGLSNLLDNSIALIVP
jgi:predicted GIY-YIG superfamily endonuclease